jgi:hypothetical protein
VAALDLVTDGVQQVRLAEADAAVEEERVVAVRGALGDGARRGVARAGCVPPTTKVSKT